MTTRRSSERLGIFGGTFDPIHVGHLVTAVNVRHELRLDALLLVVANQPWQKAERVITPAEDRFAMVAAAVADVPGLVASRLEMDRGGVSYTADTLHELLAEDPTRQLHLVVGSDAVAGIATWDRVEEVKALAQLVVVTRPGAQDDGPPAGWDCVRVEVPRLEVSSTDLRRRFVDGRPLDYLVPEDVIHVIRERHLYADGG
jgi:nicotinate-nucleotide adenylyltransferase